MLAVKGARGTRHAPLAPRAPCSSGHALRDTGDLVAGVLHGPLEPLVGDERAGLERGLVVLERDADVLDAPHALERLRHVLHAVVAHHAFDVLTVWM